MDKHIEDMLWKDIIQDNKSQRTLDVERELWKVIDKGNISEISKILHGHPDWCEKEIQKGKSIE